MVQEGEFDLDLTYITDNIIAMGFPPGDMSSGFFNFVEAKKIVLLYGVSLTFQQRIMMQAPTLEFLMKQRSTTGLDDLELSEVDIQNFALAVYNC
ncbi:uncharacterized protein LOC108227039 [Daucus carota subsp. sativus]|uniref:uncharacterized protein LOC108227039 n=1 Tax=Daucus carota subsp. sativus TaxID=79200 RepID=UPI0007EF559B|nr:PREDICTED: uncharacterized protein LOC108227039 isoform X3 [Daucus carota subsp. sativus]